MSEWIKVEERLPKAMKDEDGDWIWPVVLVWSNYYVPKRVSLGHYISRPALKEWRLEGANFDASPYITHWMPFPDPPDEA